METSHISTLLFLHRAAAWGTVNQLPQTTATGNTQVRAIPRERTLAYEQVVENRQYAAVLPQLERSAGKAPFWLDGHFMVARCLDGIGAKTAHSVECIGLVALVSQFPDVVHLKFYDGTPFASEATQTWIAHLLQRQNGEGAMGCFWGTTLETMRQKKRMPKFFGWCRGESKSFKIIHRKKCEALPSTTKNCWAVLFSQHDSVPVYKATEFDLELTKRIRKQRCRTLVTYSN